MGKMKTQMKFIGSNPVYSFIDTLTKTAASNSPRTIVIPTISQLNQVNLDLLYKVYSERFANASDMTFFIVGNVDADSITPYLEQYLGSLPGKANGETWLDKNPKFPAGVTDIEIDKGKDDKGMVGIIFDEKFEWSDQNRLAMQMTKDIISIRLIEVIREAMSGVYSPQTQLQIDKYPTPEFSLMVMFGCSPKNAGKLTKAVFSIIKSLRDKGPLEKDLEKAKEALIRKREVDAKTNKFWLSRLESYVYNGDDAALITDYNTKVNAVTVKDIQNMATKYLLKDHYVRVVLKPAKK
jgi:zinc protease